MRLSPALCLVATIWLATPAAAVIPATVPPLLSGEFTIHVDGRHAAVATRITGGDLRATPSGVAEVTPLEIDVTLPANGPVVTWMSQFFAGDGSLKTVTVSPDAGMATEYTGVRLTRVQIVNIDARLRERVTARLSLTATGRSAVRALVVPPSKRTTPLGSRSFRVSVAGVNGFEWTSRVPVFSVTQVAGPAERTKTAPRAIAPAVRTGPAASAVSVDLQFTVASTRAAQMSAWVSASLPTTPGTTPAPPTSALIEMLSPSMRDVLLTFRLEGVRLTGVANGTGPANAISTTDLNITASSVSVTGIGDR